MWFVNNWFDLIAYCNLALLWQIQHSIWLVWMMDLWLYVYVCMYVCICVCVFMYICVYVYVMYEYCHVSSPCMDKEWHLKRVCKLIWRKPVWTHYTRTPYTPASLLTYTICSYLQTHHFFPLGFDLSTKCSWSFRAIRCCRESVAGLSHSALLLGTGLLLGRFNSVFFLGHKPQSRSSPIKPKHYSIKHIPYQHIT
jgi:hypothetical protein